MKRRYTRQALIGGALLIAALLTLPSFVRADDSSGTLDPGPLAGQSDDHPIPGPSSDRSDTSGGVGGDTDAAPISGMLLVDLDRVVADFIADLVASTPIRRILTR